jgi:hypothetical protein
MFIASAAFDHLLSGLANTSLPLQPPQLPLVLRMLCVRTCATLPSLPTVSAL